MGVGQALAGLRRKSSLALGDGMKRDNVDKACVGGFFFFSRAEVGPSPDVEWNWHGKMGSVSEDRTGTGCMGATVDEVRVTYQCL